MQPRLQVSTNKAPAKKNSNSFDVFQNSKEDAHGSKNKSIYADSSFVRPGPKGLSLSKGNAFLQRAISTPDYDATAETLNMKMSSCRVVKEHESVGDSDDSNGNGNSPNIFARLARKKQVTEEFQSNHDDGAFANMVGGGDPGQYDNLLRSFSVSGPPDSPTTALKNG
jgi:hypothetical protein